MTQVSVGYDPRQHILLQFQSLRQWSAHKNASKVLEQQHFSSNQRRKKGNKVQQQVCNWSWGTILQFLSWHGSLVVFVFLLLNLVGMEGKYYECPETQVLVRGHIIHNNIYCHISNESTKGTWAMESTEMHQKYWNGDTCLHIEAWENGKNSKITHLWIRERREHLHLVTHFPDRTVPWDPHWEHCIPKDNSPSSSPLSPANPPNPLSPPPPSFLASIMLPPIFAPPVHFPALEYPNITSVQPYAFTSMLQPRLTNLLQQAGLNPWALKFQLPQFSKLKTF